jgi:uncharacterized coiled-coil DUF342 family protein
MRNVLRIAFATATTTRRKKKMMNDEIERLRADRDRWRKIAAELAMPLRHRFDPKGAWDSVNLPHERAAGDEQAEG